MTKQTKTDATEGPAVHVYPAQRRITVYQAGSLGGLAMKPEQIRDAIQSNRDHPAFRAVVQLIEANCAEALGNARLDRVLKDGMGEHYLMANGYLADLLADIADYVAGNIPGEPGK